MCANKTQYYLIYTNIYTFWDKVGNSHKTIVKQNENRDVWFIKKWVKYYKLRED
jgi:hypothetical protein